jgi:hypothetical protein
VSVKYTLLLSGVNPRDDLQISIDGHSPVKITHHLETGQHSPNNHGILWDKTGDGEKVPLKPGELVSLLMIREIAAACGHLLKTYPTGSEKGASVARDMELYAVRLHEHVDGVIGGEHEGGRATLEKVGEEGIRGVRLLPDPSEDNRSHWMSECSC